MIANRPYSHPSYAVGTDTAADRDARIVRELRQEINDLDRERADLIQAEHRTPEGKTIHVRVKAIGNSDDVSARLSAIADARRRAVETLQSWSDR